MPDGVNQKQPTRKSAHFFSRERDGSARFRIRLTPELASLVEEAAGETPLMLYMNRVLKERALYHIRKRNEFDAAHGRNASLTDPDPEDVEEDDRSA